MICLGAYWSIAIYLEWVDQQVITTASTTALPVGVVQVFILFHVKFMLTAQTM